MSSKPSTTTRREQSWALQIRDQGNPNALRPPPPLEVSGQGRERRKVKTWVSVRQISQQLTTTEDSHSCRAWGREHSMNLTREASRSLCAPRLSTPSPRDTQQGSLGDLPLFPQVPGTRYARQPNTITKILKTKLSLKPQSTKVGQALSAWP